MTYWKYPKNVDTCRLKNRMEECRGVEVLCFLKKYHQSFFTVFNIRQFKELCCLEEAVVMSYTTDEFPIYHLDKKMWQHLFDKCDPLKLFSVDGTPPTFDKITLYRASEPRYKRSLSWTADIQVAESFLNRDAKPNYKVNIQVNKRIYRIEAPRSAVAFYTNERKESEFVLRPKFVDKACIRDNCGE